MTYLDCECRTVPSFNSRFPWFGRIGTQTPWINCRSHHPRRHGDPNPPWRSNFQRLSDRIGQHLDAQVFCLICLSSFPNYTPLSESFPISKKRKVRSYCDQKDNRRKFARRTMTSNVLIQGSVLTLFRSSPGRGVELSPVERDGVGQKGGVGVFCSGFYVCDLGKNLFFGGVTYTDAR